MGKVFQNYFMKSHTRWISVELGRIRDSLIRRSCVTDPNVSKKSAERSAENQVQPACIVVDNDCDNYLFLLAIPGILPAFSQLSGRFSRQLLWDTLIDTAFPSSIPTWLAAIRFSFFLFLFL